MLILDESRAEEQARKEAGLARIEQVIGLLDAEAPKRISLCRRLSSALFSSFPIRHEGKKVGTTHGRCCCCYARGKRKTNARELFSEIPKTSDDVRGVVANGVVAKSVVAIIGNGHDHYHQPLTDGRNGGHTKSLVK